MKLVRLQPQSLFKGEILFMNKSQQVKKIIGSAIEEHGFEYKGYDRDEYVSFYSFEKKDGVVLEAQGRIS